MPNIPLRKNDIVLLERLIPYLKPHCPQLNNWGLS